MTAGDNIEEAILIAQAETGVIGGKNAVPLCFSPKSKKRNRVWTAEEEEFIRDNHGRLSENQIARELGRTVIGVHLHREREMHLTSMSKDESILTAEQVANGIGLDSKSVHLLMDTGRMPCRRLPSSRIMRVIDRIVLMKWMLDPENWLYFEPSRVGMLTRRGKRSYGQGYDFAFWENARVIITKTFNGWKDQWLTPGQVRHILGIEAAGTRYINKAINQGIFKATRWGNWWIKKSDLPGEGKTINFKGEIVDQS